MPDTYNTHIQITLLAIAQFILELLSIVTVCYSYVSHISRAHLACAAMAYCYMQLWALLQIPVPNYNVNYNANPNHALGAKFCRR